MTPHRRETNMAEAQPVRFYKYVALSFLLITVMLLGVIIFMSAKRAVITITSRPEPLEIKESVVVGGSDGGISGETEEVEIAVEKTFQPKEGREEPSVAVGKVTLHNEADYNQPLVATTRLLTENNVLFHLKDRVVVPAKGIVEAAVYADKAGKESEIGPSKFSIPGLSLDKQKLIYATSDKSMAGGWKKVGILGVSDWQNAEQELRAEMEKIGKEKLAKKHEGLTAVYQLKDVEVNSTQKVGDETDGFVLEGKGRLLGVFYDSEQIKELVGKELSKRVVSDDEVLSADNSTFSVVLQSYDASSTLATVNVVASGLVSLNPESKQLSKSMFFGKNKEEIRRYLLSLDHVQGVEIKFTPAWMRTIPPVAEHVSVVVKNVE